MATTRAIFIDRFRCSPIVAARKPNTGFIMQTNQTNTPANLHQMPEAGFLRIWQIIGNKKTNTPALLPIGRTSFLNGVKSGKYPKPVKLGERTTAWKVQDIRDLINLINQA